MKNLAFILFAILITSCKKENVLDDVILAPNKYEISDDKYVTVKNVGQINCTTIGLDITIHMDLLPKEISENIKDYRVRIEVPFGKKIIATRLKDQWLPAQCDTINEYKIALYRPNPPSETRPLVFTFETKK